MILEAPNISIYPWNTTAGFEVLWGHNLDTGS